MQHLTKQQRRTAIVRAQVWAATDVPTMDLRAGPKGRGALAPFAAVACTYVEQKMTGSSRKFACELARGDAPRGTS